MQAREVGQVGFSRRHLRDGPVTDHLAVEPGRAGQGPGTQPQQCWSLGGPSRRDHELQPGLCQGSRPLVRLLQTVKGVPPVEAVVGDEEAG